MLDERSIETVLTPFNIFKNKENVESMLIESFDRRPVSSVGRVPDYRAGGRGFKSQPDQHSGSLNN